MESPLHDRTKNQSRYKNNGNSADPLKYNFSNLNLIVQDVQKRNYFYRKTANLLERKAGLDLNYANILEEIITKQFLRATESHLASQVLYSKLVTIMQDQPRRIRERAQQLKQQADKMSNSIEQESHELKKALESAQRVSKEILHQRDKLDKIKAKYSKKNRQLQMLKIEYITGVISNQQLQKTNNVYLSLNEAEEAVKPLMQEYRYKSNHFSETAGKMIDQFNVYLGKIEEIQSKKIKNIKSAVANYVHISKLSLDTVLENYPFLCQEIDRMREKQQFQPHSCDSLINEFEEMEKPFESNDYIDVIYERIEIRKNLDEIILYGQDADHKRSLTVSFSNSHSIAQEGLDLANGLTDLDSKTLRMVDLFRSIFEGESTLQTVGQLRSLFRGDEKLRKDFILCLQQFRINSEFEMNNGKKESIIDCITAFLDVCDLQLDTYNSKMLMVLSLTYYFTEDGKKIQLQELISKHPIWSKIQWWEAALLETIYEETKMKSKIKESPIRIWDIKTGGASRKEEGQEQTHQNICFNQLLFFVRNMSLFQISHQQIIQYAKLNISMLKFSSKFSKDILDLCPKPPNPSLHQHAYSSP